METVILKQGTLKVYWSNVLGEETKWVSSVYEALDWLHEREVHDLVKRPGHFNTWGLMEYDADDKEWYQWTDEYGSNIDEFEQSLSPENPEYYRSDIPTVLDKQPEETPAEFLERELKAARETSGVGFEYEVFKGSYCVWADIRINTSRGLDLVEISINKYTPKITVTMHSTSPNSTPQDARTQAALLTIAADIAERWEVRHK